MEDFWIIISVLLAQVAVVLLVDNRIEATFVVGVLGILAWFLSLRSRLSKANAARENASNHESNDIGESDED